MSADDRFAPEADADDRYADWDAAYVLGSLAPAERHEYEQHLAHCAGCRQALADLAGMPGLLASVAPADGLGLLEPAATVDTAEAGQIDLLPALVARAGRARRRRRVVVSFAAFGAVAAAVALTLVVVLPPTLGSGPVASPGAVPSAAATPGGTALADKVTFVSEVDSPLSAVATLDDEPWGTRIDWECRYDGVIDSTYARSYAMLVTDRAGNSTQVATWTSGPGTTATPTATTSIHRSDIAAVSIISTDTGTVLLRSAL